MNPLTHKFSPEEESRTLELIYRNWKNEVEPRKIIPISLRYGTTEWHPKPQWLLKAIDTKTGKIREFALQDSNFLALAPHHEPPPKLND
jgi:hypothetical protein